MARLIFFAMLSAATSTAAGEIELESGDCTVSSDGLCFKSPNYPSNYPNYAGCDAKVTSPGFITAEHFDTESYYDKLSVGDQQYSGQYGPSLQLVPGDTSIGFHADGSNTRSGFKVCLSAANENVAPENFAPKHPKPTVSLTCIAGCSSVRMKGAETGEGYWIQAHDSTGALFAVEGAAVIDFLSYQGSVQMSLGSENFAVGGVGTQYLGTGPHNISLSGTYEALLLPTTGGFCSGWKHGGHPTCAESTNSTAVIRLSQTQHLSSRSECKSQCESWVKQNRKDLCCFFGFSEDVLGCHGIKNGIYHKHGHFHHHHHHGDGRDLQILGPVGSCEAQSVYLSPSAAALTDLSDIMMARRPEAKLLKITDADQAGSSFAVFAGILLLIAGASMTLVICKSWRSALPDVAETNYLQM